MIDTLNVSVSLGFHLNNYISSYANFFCVCELFILGIFSFIEELPRYYREFLYTLYLIFPIVASVCYHGAFVKTKKLTVVHYYELNSRLRISQFCSCPHSVLGFRTLLLVPHCFQLSCLSNILQSMVVFQFFSKNWQNLLQQNRLCRIQAVKEGQML